MQFLKSRRGLWLGLLIILALNIALYFLSFSVPGPEKQKRKDAVGLTHVVAQKFFYFYYYTGYFPLATLNDSLIYSKEAAWREIRDNGKDLIMEYKHWSRLGENARIWMYLPNAIVKGSPENPSVKLFNAIIFTVSLMVLYFGFWKVGKPLLGLILVFMINFTPFFYYEIYRNQNVFGLLGSGFFMILGLNIQLLYKRIEFRKVLLPVIISAVFIGFLSEIRNETFILLASLLLILFLSNYTDFKSKLLLSLIVVVFTMGTKKLIKLYFDRNFERTSELVAKYGGHVYTGPRSAGHSFWHPVFCGLGDFDKKYGYKWADRVAYRYALPVLKEKYSLDFKYSGKLYFDQYYDSDSLYYVKPEQIPQYQAVVRDKVISDIVNDPLWYAGILLKRILRILTVTIPFKYAGWLIFLALLLLIKYRKWAELKIIIVSLPLSATPLLIYSGDGSTYNSVFPYFAIIFILDTVFDMIKKHNFFKASLG